MNEYSAGGAYFSCCYFSQVPCIPLDRDLPGQRAPWTESSLDRELPIQRSTWTETLPWTETPWAENSSDRDPRTETSRQRPLDRNPPDRDPHMVMSTTNWYAFWIQTDCLHIVVTATLTMNTDLFLFLYASQPITRRFLHATAITWQMSGVN